MKHPLARLGGPLKRPASPMTGQGDNAGRVTRRAKLAMQLGQVDQILQELAEEAATEESSPDNEQHKTVKGATDQAALSTRTSVEVVIGTSSMLESTETVRQIYTMVNAAYGYQRLSQREVIGRLEMGDDGVGANRVLHVALLDGVPVGCMSSTFQPPWTEEGCGHWGLLVVHPEKQGRGIASQLVAAAEKRLAGTCEQIQIEYDYLPGDAHSDRLRSWYEGSCGFRCVSGHGRGGAQFRKCRKLIPPALRRAGRAERLGAIRTMLSAQLAEEDAALAAHSGSQMAQPVTTLPPAKKQAWASESESESVSESESASNPQVQVPMVVST